MRVEVVQATRAQLTFLDDAAGSALLDLVAGFPSADQLRGLRAAIDELPSDWLEKRIVEGGILDAAAVVAVIAEAYYSAGRHEQAAAELLGFMETLARVLGRLAREMLAREEAEFDVAVHAVASGCGWRRGGGRGP